MSKFVYTDEMVDRMKELCGNGVTEEVIETLCGEFEFPRRSVTAKLRKLEYSVPRKPVAPPVFSEDETTELKGLLEANEGVYTAEEIATQVAGGKFSARQINGKVLSLELTSHVKPAEKKVTPKTYTDAEEDTIRGMLDEGAFIEDIAEAVEKSVQSVRGKLLSMGAKAPQREKKAGRADPYAGIEDPNSDVFAGDHTVDELAALFDGKTTRGVKTVLTRRGLSAKDYTPPSVKDKE